jgi:HEAT repeat protein
MDKALELVKRLGSSDYYFERQKAAWALVALGEPVVDAVAEALENGEFSDLRYKSAWVLGKIKSPRAVEPLCRTLLNDADHVVREWSAAALENCGDVRAVPFLVLAMKRDSSKDVRLRAAVALRKLGAANAFRELLNSPEPETRGMAVTGLAKLACREAMREVALLVEDEDGEVRRRAAAYLGEFDVQETIDLLARALKDSEPTVRAEALKSLSRMKREQSCRMAQSALHDEDFGVRLAAVTALGEIGDSSALEPLVEVMFGNDDEEIRAWAAWSLGEIGDPRAVEHLQRAYKTCPIEVMKKARDSLVEVFKLKI